MIWEIKKACGHCNYFLGGNNQYGQCISEHNQCKKKSYKGKVIVGVVVERIDFCNHFWIKPVPTCPCPVCEADRVKSRFELLIL